MCYTVVLLVYIFLANVRQEFGFRQVIDEKGWMLMDIRQGLVSDHATMIQSRYVESLKKFSKVFNNYPLPFSLLKVCTYFN